MKRVGIFGGSFDPVHRGHLKIAESFLKSRVIDRLLILPAPLPPHKPGQVQASFRQRLEMLLLAFSGQKEVLISDLEQLLSAEPDPGESNSPLPPNLMQFLGSDPTRNDLFTADKPGLREETEDESLAVRTGNEDKDARSEDLSEVAGEMWLNRQMDQDEIRIRKEIEREGFAGREYNQETEKHVKKERQRRPSYTIDTVVFLQNRFPETLFYLCMGGDSLATFHEWVRWEEILERVTLLVAARPGTDYSCTRPEIPEKAIFADHDPVDVSSTGVRGQIRDGSGTYESVDLPEAVAEYIGREGIYGGYGIN